MLPYPPDVLHLAAEKDVLMRRALCLAVFCLIFFAPSLIADDTSCPGAKVLHFGNSPLPAKGEKIYGSGSNFGPGESWTFTNAIPGSTFLGVEIVAIDVSGVYHGHEDLFGIQTPSPPNKELDVPKLQYSKNCLKVSKSLKAPAEAHLRVWYSTGDSSYYVDVFLDFPVTIDIQWRGQKAPRASQDNSYSVKMMELGSNIVHTALDLGSLEEADFRWDPNQSSLVSDWTFAGIQLTSSPDLEDLTKATEYIATVTSDYFSGSNLIPPTDLLDPKPPGDAPILIGNFSGENGSQIVTLSMNELTARADNMTVRVDYVLWFHNKNTGKWFYVDPEIDIDLPCTNSGSGGSSGG